MKAIIQDIDELTDSKEVLQYRPNRIIIIFIYINIIMILSFFIWSFFSEKEVVVKSQGIVKPYDEVYKVTNLFTSKVKSIKFKMGQKVKKGEILCELDHSDLDIQKEYFEKTLKELNLDIQNLKKFKKSILENNNYLNKDNCYEKFYYDKYLIYEKNNIVPLSDKNNIKHEVDFINSKIVNLNLLKKSINVGYNYTNHNSIYSKQYESYKISEQYYKDKIDKVKNLYENSEDHNNTNSKNFKNELTQFEIELKKFKNDYILKIDTEIDELNYKAENLKLKFNSINDSNNLNKQKNKLNLLMQIDETIKTNNQKLTELKSNLNQINLNINKCCIKANNNGIIDIKTDIKIGDLLQSGQDIANIIPENHQYKVELYINDKDIANIKQNQAIKYRFPSLPYKEYGNLSGTIKKISADCKISKDNISFYIIQATLDKNQVFSYKGEKSEIKNGMTCEAIILTRRKKMLYYLLEKINLKD